MTRKRSTYRPRGVNLTAHLVAITGAALLTRDDRTVWALQMHDALDAVARGKAQRQQWGVIFDAVNLAEELTRMGLASDPDGVIREAQDACAEIIRRQQATGTRAVRAGELAALRCLEAAMIDILAAVTHSERFRAEQRIRARTREAQAGRIPGAEVIDPAVLEGR
jgi:hypothetical protein